MTWLVAIGLTNAASASLLAVVAWTVGRWGRRPALARLLWLVVLAKLLTPPVYEPALGGWFSIPLHETPAEWERSQAARADFAVRRADMPRAAIPLEDSRAAEKTLQRTSAAPSSFTAAERWHLWQMLAAVRSATWLRLAGFIWIMGSLVCAIRFVLRTWRFRRFLARAAHVDADLTRRAAQLAQTAGLRSSPQVLAVRSAVSPMLWGAGRGARLLFPTELAKSIPPATRDALLLHELAHWARGDWLVRLLELVVQVIYWWHPLVRWARGEIEIAEEECCDAWVLEHQAGTRRCYAEALLATLDFLSGPIPSLPPAACGLGSAALIRVRLTQIMCGNLTSRASRKSRALVLAAAALALPISPGFFGTPPHESLASSTPPGNAPLAPPQPASLAPRQTAREETRAADRDRPASGSWFVPRPSDTRPTSVLYATAVTANGRYKLEARTGQRATLVEVSSNKRLDLSSYRIVAASFSPDSRLLITAQDDESGVRLWDCETGGMLRMFKGSEAVVMSVAFSPDGERVAAGAADGSVLVWNIGDDDAVCRLPRQDMPASCLRWSQEGDRLAIALGEWSNRDASTLLVWRPGEASFAEELSLDHSLGALDWLDKHTVIVADWNGDARVVDLTSGIAMEHLRLGKDIVSAAAFSPDCRLSPRWQAMARLEGVE